MSVEVFNRYEKKFLINEETFQIVQERLLEYMSLDDYHQNIEFYPISNIYFDTKDNYLIRNSLSKPKYKEKLRLRAYGVPKENDKVYLEIKKKFNGLVNKRRSVLKLHEAYNFVNTGVKPEVQSYMNHQVLNEIEYFLKRYALIPKLYLAYDRKAMFSKDGKDLRITFDTNIRSRRFHLKLESGDYGETILEKGMYLMEIKAEKSLPLWLTQLLSEHKIYSTSFSKYGKVHMDTNLLKIRRNMFTKNRLRGRKIHV